MPSSKPKSFTATLEKLHGGLGWTIVRLPFRPSDAFPRMIRHRVRGTINGLAFRNSLFPLSAEPGCYFLLVNRELQRQSGAAVGESAVFTLSADLDPRPADLPEELDAMLDQAEGLREFYDSLSESMRREAGKWIQQAKSEASRQRRAGQTAERLLSAMEAEHELPPQIARALKSAPGAMAGWKLLTPYQRRCELLAVYHYQSLEAREKRVAKLVDTALRKKP